jgi:hypothetical protein
MVVVVIATAFSKSKFDWVKLDEAHPETTGGSTS